MAKNFLYGDTFDPYCKDFIGHYLEIAFITFCDRCPVVVWYGAGLATARSWVRIPPTAAVHQRRLRVSFLRGRLMSASES